ncbi:hypothetical protein FA09DRAFT_326366 [Tilletiopsis washingtonensis]|uniref:Uncharacterized protein n=1 Tax=Tilletiopsis washingtonensis TaxID=58919 RepID=A0A316Z6X6_9BASI|nr:hypothetical protein FA09DRAFT_326366 [Tilletiopsis washingtonensis]PWN95975.1 hypothetical protein FA09DRAFT_326366 [Tilletiopsis washingtonensis]
MVLCSCSPSLPCLSLVAYLCCASLPPVLAGTGPCGPKAKWQTLVLLRKQRQHCARSCFCCQQWQNKEIMLLTTQLTSLNLPCHVRVLNKTLGIASIEETETLSGKRSKASAVKDLPGNDKTLLGKRSKASTIKDFPGIEKTLSGRAVLPLAPQPP